MATVIEPDHHGVYVPVVLAILGSLNLLFFAWRLYIRYPFQTRVSWDDIMVTLALVLSIGQGIATGVAYARGLGQHSSTLSADALLRLHQSLFASDVLYVLATGFARLACVFLIYRLARPLKSIIPVRVVCLLLAIWVLVGTLVITVPAGRTKLWEPSAQIGETLFSRWLGVTATSMALELIVLLLPIYVVWGLRASFNQKSIFVGVFGLRCGIIIFAGLRLHALHSALASNDYSWMMPRVALFTQFELHLSIITATLPILPCFAAVLSAEDSRSLIPSMHRRSSARSRRSHDSKYWETSSELNFTGNHSGIYTPTCGSVTTSIRKGSVDSCTLTGMFIHKETTYQTVCEEYTPPVPAPPAPIYHSPHHQQQAGESQPLPAPAALSTSPPSSFFTITSSSSSSRSSSRRSSSATRASRSSVFTILLSSTPSGVTPQIVLTRP